MGTSDAHALAAARIDQYLMERTLRQKPPGQTAPIETPVRPAITISRTLGIPGLEIASAVASRLGFHLIDHEILDAIGRDTRLGDRILASLDSGSHSAINAWLAGLIGGERLVDVHSFHHMVSRVIRGVSMHGNAVILGRGGNFVLRGTDAFRVRLTAPAALRARAVQASKGLSFQEACREVDRHDEKRRQFIQAIFRGDIDDPYAYDAIFNLRRLDTEPAAELVVEMYCRTHAGA